MRPMAIAPNYGAFPGELRALPIWLLWDYRLNEKGEWTKIPLVADGSGKFAATNRAETWRSFDEAIRFASRVSGVGVRFVEPYCGIDLDKCRDKKNGG
jgi:primase-polymerase (primpol)-like protein